MGGWSQGSQTESVGKWFLENPIRYMFKPRNKDIAGEIIDLISDGHYDLINPYEA